MIKFEIDNSKMGIEIYLDAEGVNELINYLNFIKNRDEHMHLVAGNELSEDNSSVGNEVAKHVKLVYVS